MKIIPGSIWRHYKGGFYWFVSGAQHEATGEKMAVYRCTVTGKTYVRPIEEFLQKFELKKEQSHDPETI